METTIRFAQYDELGRVNELRRQIQELHAGEKPGIFKAGFPGELRDLIYTIFSDPDRKIAVCERDGVICAYAVLNRVKRPETPFMKERDYLDIDELCVDEGCRRQGIASAMIGFICDYARSEGFDRVELNVWEFNRDALAFYESAGFSTCRRYMEKKL